jgi:hypothetical protein
MEFGEGEKENRMIEHQQYCNITSVKVEDIRIHTESC